MMERTAHLVNTPPILAALVLVLSGCAGTLATSDVHDPVYDRAEAAPVRAARTEEPAPTKEERSAPADVDTEDYYDAGEAKTYANGRGYYDMTYNDPYYYNYGRFGFGMGLGLGGYYGSPYGSLYYGYNSPYGGWYDPYYSGWNSPYSGWGYPYSYGYGSYWPYGGYYSGYYSGYGSYCGYGYYGPGSWYGTPIYVSDGGTTGNGHYVGHRPSLTDGAGSGTTSTTHMTPPVGERIRLYPNAAQRPELQRRPSPVRTMPRMERHEGRSSPAVEEHPARTSPGRGLGNDSSSPSPASPSRSAPSTGGSGGNTGHRR
ncbi:MAG: hypothetical protein H6594_05280 [Flavobacteriales bacterium]|nr:hypothetical protein [Flavobacteriales bacterium]